MPFQFDTHTHTQRESVRVCVRLSVAQKGPVKDKKTLGYYMYTTIKKRGEVELHIDTIVVDVVKTLNKDLMDILQVLFSPSHCVSFLKLKLD